MEVNLETKNIDLIICVVDQWMNGEIACPMQFKGGTNFRKVNEPIYTHS